MSIHISYQELIKDIFTADNDVLIIFPENQRFRSRDKMDRFIKFIEILYPNMTDTESTWAEYSGGARLRYYYTRQWYGLALPKGAGRVPHLHLNFRNYSRAFAALKRRYYADITFPKIEEVTLNV